MTFCKACSVHKNGVCKDGLLSHLDFIDGDELKKSAKLQGGSCDLIYDAGSEVYFLEHKYPNYFCDACETGDWSTFKGGISGKLLGSVNHFFCINPEHSGRSLFFLVLGKPMPLNHPHGKQQFERMQRILGGRVLKADVRNALLAMPKMVGSFFQDGISRKTKVDVCECTEFSSVLKKNGVSI